MKRLTQIGWFCVLLLLLGSASAWAKKQAQERVVVAYVSSWGSIIPDPTVMTHINYAFGHVNESFNGVKIDNLERLQRVVALKQQAPQLKVMLSVGGWGSGRFSEMAASKENRDAFAKDCRRWVNELGLDGIDIDWEYPTQGGAGISASPNDTENYTALMEALRKALGKYLLTAATVCNAKFINFRECLKYMDFVNVMAYDMGSPPKHHAALYAGSPISSYCTVSQAVEAHLKAGVPADKLVLGMPFYGRGSNEGVLRDFVKTHYLDSNYIDCWDEKAQAPYVANRKGELVLGYENTRSLAAKCQYAIDHQLRGGMYWEYNDDNSQGDERQTLYLSLMKHGRGVVPPRKVLVLAEAGGQHEGFTTTAIQWLKQKETELNAEFTVLPSAKVLQAGDIAKYHLVLQLNYPPYAWSEAAQRDLEQYVDRGFGSYIGFHHASLLGDFDGYPLWNWFSSFMGKIRYRNYIANMADATVQVEDLVHPVMKGVAPTFVVKDDEWYTYETNPRPNVHVLAHVDEASYTPMSDIKMGDHPVIWTNPAKRARNVYFQFGHSASLFQNEAFLKMFTNALHWTLRDEPLDSSR